ncbi:MULTISPECIES: hypothetical protein [Lactobacillaceae]|uniref:hypothetical protein n=1 Tax=Lactobacillaceae TaxID=33958 RepID=UPI0025B0F62F|nr:MULTISPECIES: hypothetical protein [Lactobacillaceae]MDN2453454.1 hypothetical protein [Lactobacillus sp. UCMA15818]MDV7758461.1 hypothetical protein [Liquorilactobacillus mali]
MNNTAIEKTEARVEKDTEWRLSNQENGYFLDVVFCKKLENTMKNKRNFSFNRFESEQLNNLHSLITELDGNFKLILDEKVIGLDYLPLSSDDAADLVEAL